MRFKGYGPVITIIALLIVLVGAQSMLSRAPQPEMFQSQVGGTGNSLRDVTAFDLDLELQDGNEIEMLYRSQGEEAYVAAFRREDRALDLTGEEAVDQLRIIIESIPSFTTTESLTLIQGILDQLQVHQGDIKDFELEYELVDGTERSIELEVDHERDDDNDNEEDDDGDVEDDDGSDD